MDDSKGPTTSTAAAVADGANAVAPTKSMTESHNQPQIAMNASSTSVRLLIKASNQQHDDLAIDSDLLWSVKRLKIYLSSVHPSKPLVHEQKLIYSGQLLNDKLLLKEVIRSYKDVYTQNHIIHLVCSNKNMPTSSLPKNNRLNGKFNGNSTTNENSNGNGNGSGNGNGNGNSNGGRQRITLENIIRQGQGQHQMNSENRRVSSQYNSSELPSNNGQRQQGYQQFRQPPYQHSEGQALPRMKSKSTQVTNLNFNPNNWQSLLHQQAAMNNWLQQVYTQYMEHCIRLSNVASNMNGETGNRNSEADNVNTDTSYIRNIGWPNYTPLNIMPLMIQPLLRPYLYDNSADASSVIGFPNSIGIHSNNNYHATRNAVNGQIPAQGRTPVIEQPAPSTSQQQIPVQTPVQPATGMTPGAQYPNIIQDEPDNHDWLDGLFTLVRLMFFLTLLYINSSTQRCLVVFIIAAIMYCYHVGLFRRRHERNNNNLNRNNNEDRGIPVAPATPPNITLPTASVDIQQQSQQDEQPSIDSDNQQTVLGSDIRRNSNDNLIASTITTATTSATTSATSNQADSNNNNSMTSALAFMQTFIVTFFTSLFPETPAL